VVARIARRLNPRPETTWPILRADGDDAGWRPPSRPADHRDPVV